SQSSPPRRPPACPPQSPSPFRGRNAACPRPKPHLPTTRAPARAAPNHAWWDESGPRGATRKNAKAWSAETSRNSVIGGAWELHADENELAQTRGDVDRDAVLTNDIVGQRRDDATSRLEARDREGRMARGQPIERARRQ